MGYAKISLDTQSLGDLGELQKILIKDFNLDVQNALYFSMLLSQKGQNPKITKMTDNPNEDGFLPLSIAGATNSLEINVAQYSDLLNSRFEKSASNIHIRPLLAGLGTSVERSTHIQKHAMRKPDELGTKSTDLFVNYDGGIYSILDLMLLQLLRLAEENNCKVILEPLVSPQTEELIKKQIKESEEFNKKFQFGGTKLQMFVPTYDLKTNFLTAKHKAPAGHGFFGFKTLLDIIEKDSRDEIYVVCNGEDLNAIPPPLAYDWFNQISEPICMITTTKTEVDKKGGQIGIVSEGNNKYVSIFEKAQAEASGQLNLFSEMGLRKSDEPGLFNTNTVFIHSGRLINILKSKGLSKLTDEFLENMRPDLIQNKKTKSDGDKVIQLEGAMGSVMLNLDRWFRAKFKTPLVAFLNVDTIHRADFFCPIKTAFDYIHKFNSNRFVIEHFRLKDKSPGRQISVKLEDPTNTYNYNDVETCLKLFKDCRLKDLEELTVTGPVDFSGTTLSGRVIINNPSNEPFYLYGFGRTHGPTDPKNIKIDLSGDSGYIVEDI